MLTQLVITVFIFGLDLLNYLLHSSSVIHAREVLP
jgi:hypothetical protein